MTVSAETYMALATLTPGTPQADLVRILADRWSPPSERSKGFVFLHIYAPGEVSPKSPFSARIADDGTIGTLGFHASFEGGIIAAVGLAIGAPAADVRQRFPDAVRDEHESAPKYGIEAWRCDLGNGTVAIAKIKEDRLLAVSLERVGATYPGELTPEAARVRTGLRAYDLEMLPRFVDPADNHGWVFGLPPGITTAQWPLDPVSGYPLMHGFTVLLPEDHRVHGPDIVGLSFFATAADQNDGGTTARADLHATVTGTGGDANESADLAPFRAHAATAHPRLHRMKDILDYEYAVILLTEAEFRGAACQPPRFAANPYLKPNARPKWLDTGSGYSCFKGNGGAPWGDGAVEETYICKLLGAIPDQRLDWHRAIRCTPRAVDPNAGIPPQEVYDAPSPQGYQSPFDAEAGFKLKPWAETHKENHIGGTMRPTQGMPGFSPFYIEFEEYFGDYNFGAGGNAQLDFLLMKFDWACG